MAATIGSNCGITTGRNGVICAATTQVNAEICEDLCPTITEAAGMSGNNKPYVAYTLKMREGCAGGGKGPLIQTDKSGTLACGNDQVLFQPITPRERERE